MDVCSLVGFEGAALGFPSQNRLVWTRGNHSSQEPLQKMFLRHQKNLGYRSSSD